jgi:hypothetical protein
MSASWYRPTTPDYIGYYNPSGFGAGGMWFVGQKKLGPIVWRIQWPIEITDALVSNKNPTGAITNSDLEMAGMVLHKAVLKSHLGSAMEAAHLVIGCNNSLPSPG